jgi:cytochrome c biogenesis protein CcdA
MDSRKLYDRVFTIFGTMMVFFYLGFGYIILFSSYLDYIEKPLRVIIGIPLIIYGLYRAFVSYNKIKENFFDKEESE